MDSGLLGAVCGSHRVSDCWLTDCLWGWGFCPSLFSLSPQVCHTCTFAHMSIHLCTHLDIYTPLHHPSTFAYHIPCAPMYLHRCVCILTDLMHTSPHTLQMYTHKHVCSGIHTHSGLCLSATVLSSVPPTFSLLEDSEPVSYSLSSQWFTSGLAHIWTGAGCNQGVMLRGSHVKGFVEGA